MGSALPVEPETKRKPNFTDAEKLFLVQQYELYKPILSSRLCDGVTNRQKQDIWLKITAELNSRNPHVDRTTKDVKKKWENLATQARKEIIDYRQNADADSSVVAPPSAITFKVLQLLDDAPVADYDYDETPFRIASASLDNDDDTDRIEPAIEIDGAAAADDLSPRLLENEPSLQTLMDIWKQRQLVADRDGVDDRLSPIRPDQDQEGNSKNCRNGRRRRRRDEYDDSDSNASPKIARDDVKKLKRLKLFLETEKLMLEKRKLELEILVLTNQLRKDSI